MTRCAHRKCAAVRLPEPTDCAVGMSTPIDARCCEEVAEVVLSHGRHPNFLAGTAERCLSHTYFEFRNDLVRRGVASVVAR